MDLAYNQVTQNTHAGEQASGGYFAAGWGIAATGFVAFARDRAAAHCNRVANTRQHRRHSF